MLLNAIKKTKTNEEMYSFPGENSLSFIDVIL